MFFFGTNEDNLTLVVPEEFSEIARDTKRSMAGFHDYCKVYANLYGICDPETVISKWYVNHSDNPLSKSQGIAEFKTIREHFKKYCPQIGFTRIDKAPLFA